MSTTTRRTRSERLEIRTTPEDRALIERAVAASATDFTDFAITHLCVAAHRILADRRAFAIDETAQQTWDDINERPARSVAGLRNLLDRPSPFEQ